MSTFKETFSVPVCMDDGNYNYLLLDAVFSKEEALEKFKIEGSSLVKNLTVDDIREEWVRFGFYGNDYEEAHNCWHFNDYGPTMRGTFKAWIITIP